MPTFVTDEVVSATKLNNATARDYTTWSPTYVNLTVGAGVVTARFMQLGSEAVACYWRLVCGATPGIGGAVSVSPPVAPHASQFTQVPIGTARFVDANGSTFAGQVTLTAVDRITLQYVDTNGVIQNTSSTAPFTWASGDTISFSCVYEIGS